MIRRWALAGAMRLGLTQAPGRFSHPRGGQNNGRRLTLARLLNLVVLLLRRLLTSRLVLTLLALSAFFVYALRSGEPQAYLARKLDEYHAPPRMPQPKPLAELPARLPCVGPRGKLLSESPDDELKIVDLKNVEYPTPFVGSYADINLPKTWMTVDGRYGPYGYGEHNKTYTRKRVDWNKVNWGVLQNACFERNAHRFPAAAEPFRAHPARFTHRQPGGPVPDVRPWHETKATRRTALILRTYDGYKYSDEDLWYVRSLIVEAGLRTGGEYQVVLLVNVHGRDWNILESQENYDLAMEAANIPKELQNITVLWDDYLLESWYPGVYEHRTMWQVNQPLQLFAHFYPEFDHYWQLEMDQRYMGDAGVFLDALSAFARAEPRKQALERATFMHAPAYYSNPSLPDYRAFTAAVDKANNGTSHVWGPLRVHEVVPIGPKPPFASARDDTGFTWGVGEDADVVVSSFCKDVTRSETWVFRDWINGFRAVDGTRPRNWRAVPRWFCPPAVQRASRNLLGAVHAAQAVKGLSIPSEATLPSFALWHGLKMSYPPQPVFIRDMGDADEMHKWTLGGPSASDDGWGHGDPQWSGEFEGEPKSTCTWWWAGGWPRQVMDVWLGRADPAADAVAEDEYGRQQTVGGLPYLLAKQDGQFYMPNMALHPVKNK